MLLKDRAKWYGAASGFVFLAVSALLAINDFTDPKIGSVVGYIKFTAGLSALFFGLLFLVARQSSLGGLEDKVKWYGVLSACIFLIISTYVQVTWIFYDVRVGRLLNHLEFAAALSTLIFGLLSFPKWQSFFALAVWVYSLYRFSQPAFGVA